MIMMSCADVSAGQVLYGIGATPYSYPNEAAIPSMISSDALISWRSIEARARPGKSCSTSTQSGQMKASPGSGAGPRYLALRISSSVEYKRRSEDSTPLQDEKRKKRAFCRPHDSRKQTRGSTVLATTSTRLRNLPKSCRRHML